MRLYGSFKNTGRNKHFLSKGGKSKDDGASPIIKPFCVYWFVNSIAQIKFLEIFV